MNRRASGFQFIYTMLASTTVMVAKLILVNLLMELSPYNSYSSYPFGLLDNLNDEGFTKATTISQAVSGDA